MKIHCLKMKIKNLFLSNSLSVEILKKIWVNKKKNEILRNMRLDSENESLRKIINERDIDDVVWKECVSKTRVLDDVVSCFLLYGVTSTEYYLYDFFNKRHKERNEYLSDAMLDAICMESLQDKWRDVYNQLRDKLEFYKLTSKFFKREVFVYSKNVNRNDFISFIQKNQKFIAKPLRGTMGANTHIVDMSNYKDLDLFEQAYGDNQEWIFEELINQSSEMSAWNPTSVNTVRIPSYREKKAIETHYPFFRTGRAGMVVDNGGQGGIFASIDVQTGCICTNGADEKGHEYIEHPDSKLKFKNWKIPQWKELLQLSAEIHRSLPLNHKYVAFDFALTSTGWVLVEGNWGQFVCQQMTLKKGLKKTFEKLMRL